MKIKNLFLAVLALLAFNACTYVPEPPYKFPTNGGTGGTETEEGVYINETFASEFGVFSTAETVGDIPWIIDYKTAKMTSYVDTDGDTKGDTNKEATSWLISSPVDFTNETEAVVTFDYIIRYSESGKVAANHQLLVSSDYSGDAAAATWTDIPYNAVEGADWVTFAKANVAVPSEFMSKSGIVFAIRYTAKSKASTWEVKNFKVKHGKPEDGTEEKPEDAVEYTVAEAMAAFTGAAKPAIVKGYIVGTINGQVYEDGCAFSGTATSNTNLLIADSPDETDNSKCMPVQLPTGTVRSALNLVDNPGNYKKLVTLTGSLEKYFGVAGLKTVSKYVIDGVTPEEPEVPKDAILSETFESSLGAFTSVQTVGNYPWINEYSTAKMTSYVDTDGDNKGDTNKEATSWLISPAIDLTSVTEAYIAFEYIIRYSESGKVAEHNQLMISSDYSSDAAVATWTNIPYGAVEGSDWNNFYKANVAIPAEFIGKANITIALKYTATETKAGTWEVKNFVVANGKAEESTPETPETPETPSTPVVPEGDNLIANVSFEAWSGNVADGWNGPGHNATVSQSTDARTGDYSIVVNGDANNKRLASQSYTLAAGTYTFSVYVKANGADKGYCRLGYVPVVDGAADSKKYTYETAAASAVTDEWTARVYEFTLAEETEVAFVVMNNSKGGGASFLVDDAQLTIANGGVSGGTTGGDDNEEGDNEEGEEQQPETPATGKSFTAVTSITDGKYVIAAGTNMAIPLDASKQYGYLPVTTVTPDNGVIKTAEENAYTIEAVEGGYTIKDSLDRYLYMTGNYNSVNLDTTLPAEGAVWTIEFNTDGTAKITNTYNNKYMQYSSQYNSYGIYPDERGDMPTLYKMN